MPGRDEGTEFPFHPVVLKPEGYFVAHVELSMPDTFPEVSRLYFDELFLDYTVLGTSRAEYVPMGVYIAIQNTQPPNCQ